MLQRVPTSESHEVLESCVSYMLPLKVEHEFNVVNLCTRMSWQENTFIRENEHEQD